MIETDALTLARQIRTRSLSPVEVVDAVLRRIEALQPTVNAFITVTADEAREAARRAETALMAGADVGPLLGVPFSVKDLLFTRGTRSTMGSLIFADQVPAEDAVPVRRLHEAGAILIGKTTTPEFGHKPLTDSPLFGATRNPWDLSRTAGGSSGGAAAAVATGQGPLALGTDGGGSIRIPAACCGIVGLKPTLGRVPHVHQADLFSTTSYIGPMARSVSEVAACFDMIVGFDPGDPYSRPEPLDDPRGVEVRGLRLGWLPRGGNRLVDPEVLAACAAAVRHLESRGARVEIVEEDLAAFDRSSWCFSRVDWPRGLAHTWRSSPTRWLRACGSRSRGARGGRRLTGSTRSASGPRSFVASRPSSSASTSSCPRPSPGRRSRSTTTPSSRSRSAARPLAR